MFALNVLRFLVLRNALCPDVAFSFKVGQCFCLVYATFYDLLMHRLCVLYILQKGTLYFIAQSAGWNVTLPFPGGPMLPCK